MKKLLFFCLFFSLFNVSAYSYIVEIGVKGCDEGNVISSENSTPPICTISSNHPNDVLRIYINFNVPVYLDNEDVQGDYFFWIKYEDTEMDAPICWCYEICGQWLSCACDDPLYVYQGNLFPIQNFEILSIPYNMLFSLPKGSYELHFAVDSCRNGKIDYALQDYEPSNCLLGDTSLIIRIAKEEEGSRLNVKNWAYQLQDPNPDIIASSGFDMVVMDYSEDGTIDGEFSSEEIQKIKDAGVLPIAYLSIGEAEDYRFYWQEDWYITPPVWLGEENPQWEGNFAVKYWDDEWRNILHSYVDKIIEQGFSGVYLDKVDEFEYWSNYEGGENKDDFEEEYAKRMINLILDIANYARRKVGENFYIICQNGEKILAYDNGTLIDTISGWAAEDIFYNETQLWSEEEKRWIEENRIPYLKMVISEAKPVFSVDYVDDGSGYIGENKLRIDDYISRATSKGFIPYVAIYDRELDEINVINNIQP